MKRFISLILSTLMVFSMLVCLPFSASAVTVSGKSDFFAALSDASIAEVKLGADIEITNDDDTVHNVINLNGIDRTIDLNGHTITTTRNLASDTTFNVVTKSSGTKLTITNSSEEGGINSVTTHGLISVESSANDFVLCISGLDVTLTSGSQTFIYGNDNSSAKNTIIIEDSVFTVIGNNNKHFISYKFTDISIKNTRFVKTDTRTQMAILDTDNSVKVVDVLDEGDAVYFGDVKATYDEETLLGSIYLFNSNVMEIVFKEEVPLVDVAYVSDEAELITAAGDKDVKTVILSGDIPVTSALDIIVNGNDRVLDLNGHTITVSDSVEMKIKYYTGSKFTINDSSPDGSGTVVAGRYARPINAYNYMYSSDVITLIINGGTYVGRDSSDIFLHCNNMKFIINGGLFKIGGIGHLFYSNSGGTVELNKLTIQSTSDYYYAIHEGSFADLVASTVMPATAKLIYTDSEGVETDVSSNTLSKTYSGNTTLRVVNETEPVQYTVIFHTNGAASIASQTVTSGNTAVEPLEPTKDYYTFAGWYSDSELTTPFDFETPITSDTDLYAKWTETEHRWKLIETVDATCTEDGYFLETCLTCGDERRIPIEAYGHDWGEWRQTTAPTCTENGEEERVCNRNLTHKETRELDALDHTWGEWTITTPATCGAEGVETRVCGRDGTHVETRPIPATGNHSWALTETITPAGCLVNGGGTYTCSECGATKIDIIAALGHDMLVDEVGAQATCTEDGNLPYCYCRRCGNYFIDSEGNEQIDGKPVIKATGHTPEAIPAVAATCTKAGKTEGSKCSVCGEILTAQTTVAALGHKSDKGTVTKKATYTATGTKTYKCTVCGKVIKTETIAKLKAPTVAQVTGLKTTKQTTKAITLKWSSSKNADKYLVYRSKDGKEWTKLGSTKALTYTDKDLKAGTKYQYKVRGYHSASKATGKYSTVLKAGTLTAAPKITKLTSTKTKTATVTWDKVTGAKSYIVFKSTDNRKWDKGTSTTKTTLTLSKLTGGKKIYVKVIAVNAYGKNSAASAVKSVTVKK